METWLFAQGADPSIVGSSGWAGAGLLGLVLGWLLLVHLPAKDKLMRDLISEFRSESKEQRESSRASLSALRDDSELRLDRVCEEYKQSMADERAACDRRNDSLVRSIAELVQVVKKT